MFDNIGKKIKYLAITCCVIASIISFVGGVALLSSWSYSEWGVPLMFLGPLCSYIASLLIYAFGELVDNSSSILEKLNDAENKDTNEAKKVTKENLK